MRKMQSEFHRNNHHSLNRKQSPLSLHNSKNDSVTKIRKMSTASLKQNIPDLQKLIMDIKISPTSDPVSDNIKQIYNSLKKLQNNSKVADQVHAVYLLMQSIQNKLSSSSKQKYRPPSQLILKRDSTMNDSKQLSQVSPIKQINQDTSSRILYTNFSLKELEKTVSEQNSLVQSSKGSATKVAVSKFQQCQNNKQVQNLNQQIKYLQKLLASKTKGVNVAADLTLFKKKSYRY